ncbi:MAG TPA: hypothetical protein VK457_22565 [Chloroflexota bacterium]|nr:hypothetical protein [Chloroflexota bacterium]
MTDPDNTVNRTLEAERITGIRYGTAASAQQGLGYAYWDVRPAGRILAAAILWLWQHARRRPSQSS